MKTKVEESKCKCCHNYLPIDYKDDTCLPCKEYLLFKDVKEYIRANDVSEFQVAEHFGVSVRLIKLWIREGRIQYKETNNNKYINIIRCKECSKPILGGELCPECSQRINGIKGFLSPDFEKKTELMRYFGVNKPFRK